MRITPTLEGGLRIDTGDEGDWMLLLGITRDAVSCDENLSLRLGKLITDAQLAGDWRDFIVPELEEGFHTDLAKVADSIQAARTGGEGCLWITRDNAFHWYSALNQARLALQEIHQFGPTGQLPPAALGPESRNAFLRSQLYCAIQSLLLDHVMN